MRRFNQLFLRSALFAALVAGVLVLSTIASPASSPLGLSLAFAQDEDPEMTFEEDEATEEDGMVMEDEPEGDGEEPEPELDEEPEPEMDPDGDSNAGAASGSEVEAVSWQDIVVVVRKPFLKVSRIEIQPSFGITMNDNIIRHYQLAGALNYYLTDVLAVGVEGQYYVKDLREPFDLVARQARRLPTVNQYNFGAALNFHYVPIYGKFAVLDKHIISWETSLTAGVGFTQSEVIPRDPALQPFKNTLITPNVGASMRFFISRFLTVHAGIRDYVFVDNFESVNRTEPSGSIAKENADSSLVNNIMFQTGVSFWFPMSFEYTTFR